MINKIRQTLLRTVQQSIQEAVVVGVQDSLSNYTGSSGRNLPALTNTRTGLGGTTDKTWTAAFFIRRLNRQQANTLYRMAWTVAKMIDIPVDDMFSKQRNYTDTNKDAVKSFKKGLRQLRADLAMKNAMKAARLYGGAVIYLSVKGQDPRCKPLDLETIQQGQLSNLIVVDRYNAKSLNYIGDPYESGYGLPFQYRLTLSSYSGINNR